MTFPPVFNTFIEFRIERPTRRCRSAPPEVLVQVTVADAKRKRQRRRRAPPNYEQTLWHFRRKTFREQMQLIAQRILSKRRCDRWGMLAHRVFAVHRAAARMEIALTMGAVLAELTPTLQVRLPHLLFLNVANSLGIYQDAFAMLLFQKIRRIN